MIIITIIIVIDWYNKSIANSSTVGHSLAVCIEAT